MSTFFLLNKETTVFWIEEDGWESFLGKERREGHQSFLLSCIV